jgi:hypothetical protein
MNLKSLGSDKKSNIFKDMVDDALQDTKNGKNYSNLT